MRWRLCCVLPPPLAGASLLLLRLQASLVPELQPLDAAELVAAAASALVRAFPIVSSDRSWLLCVRRYMWQALQIFSPAAPFRQQPLLLVVSEQLAHIWVQQRQAGLLGQVQAQQGSLAGRSCAARRC